LEGKTAMYHFTAFVTCLAILFYFFTSVRVARAHAEGAHDETEGEADALGHGRHGF